MSTNTVSIDSHLNSRLQHDFVEVFVNNGKKGGVYQACSGRKNVGTKLLEKAFRPELVPDRVFVVDGQLHFAATTNGTTVEVVFAKGYEMEGAAVQKRVMWYAQHVDSTFPQLALYDAVFNPDGKNRGQDRKQRASLVPPHATNTSATRNEKKRKATEENWDVAIKTRRTFDDTLLVLPLMVLSVFRQRMETSMCAPAGSIKSGRTKVFYGTTIQEENANGQPNNRLVDFLPSSADNKQCEVHKGHFVYDPSAMKWVGNSEVNTEDFLFLDVGGRVSQNCIHRCHPGAVYPY
jgi:hypothetical protein